MGVPLSSYTVLKYVADGVESKRKKNSTTMELALESMKEFSVFAFVLHDPNIHHDFHTFFERQFKSLHRTTGRHLLFFGLVDSPENLALTGNTPFYQDIRDMVDEYEEHQRQTGDQSYSAFALANSLNIDPHMLPAIIITHDTRLKSFKLVKTCSDKIETQMSRLTNVSFDMEEYKQRNKSLVERQEMLYQLLDEADIDLCSGMGEGFLTECLARALSDVLSFLVTDSEFDIFGDIQVMNIAKRHKRELLNKLTITLKALKKKINEINNHEVEKDPLYPLIEELSIKLAVFLKMLQNENSYSTLYSLPIKDYWLESNSAQLLKTAIEVEGFLRNKKTNLDFSPSAICLAKMFEREINYSIVHWFRKKHSIDLPRFFNQVQPGVEAYETTKNPNRRYNSHVNLNDRRKGKWASLELGVAKTIAKFNLTDKEWESMGIANSEKFLSDWDNIHYIRNQAAHTELITLEQYMKMKKSLENTAENNVLEKLSNMKNTYKGTPAIL
ncbi:hypothetical protein [Evansella clarkii]|uniref:hypothetical protein n=1 Tax=Evansella clarkii TaxID=79879 RepID=UPI000B42D7F6|nr:hypothetical protein [Evansella clarkii]